MGAFDDLIPSVGGQGAAPVVTTNGNRFADLIPAPVDNSADVQEGEAIARARAELTAKRKGESWLASALSAPASWVGMSAEDDLNARETALNRRLAQRGDSVLPNDPDYQRELEQYWDWERNIPTPGIYWDDASGGPSDTGRFLTFDEAKALAQRATLERRAALRDKIAAEPTKRPAFERLTDLAAHGATLGLDDEAIAGLNAAGRLISSGGDLSAAGQAYNATRGERQSARAETAAEYPILGTASTILGHAAAAGNAPQNALAQTAVLPSFLARTKTAAKVGAGFGAVTGVTNSNGSLENRLWAGGKGAIEGALTAPLISEVAVPLVARGYGVAKSGVDYARRAIQSARNPDQAAIESVADAVAAAGVDPAALRSALTPRLSSALAKRGFTDADLADIISRQMQGETAAAIAADYTARGQKIGAPAINGYFKNYRAANPTPMSIADITQEIAGQGGATPVLRLGRRAYSLAGDEAAADASAELANRQLEQPGRVEGIVQQSGGGRTFEGEIDRLKTVAKADENAAYGQAHVAQQPFDLQRVLSAARKRAYESAGKIAEGLHSAVDLFYMPSMTQRAQSPMTAYRIGKLRDTIAKAEAGREAAGISAVYDQSGNVAGHIDEAGNITWNTRGVGGGKTKVIYDGPELDKEDVESVVAYWNYIREMNATKKPESLSDFVVRHGGVYDPGGDVRLMIGRQKDRPGLIKKPKDTGANFLGKSSGDNANTLDDMALRAWENGFFEGHTRRPTINEFLDALADDLSSGAVVRGADNAYSENIRAAYEMDKELEALGIRPGQFRKEETLRAFLTGKNAPTANEVAAARAGKGGESTEDMRRRLKAMEDQDEVSRPLTERKLGKPLLGTERYIAARDGLSDMIQRSYYENKPTILTGQLTQLRKELNAQVWRTNPLLAKADLEFAGNRTVERILEQGMKTGTSLTPVTREAIREFRDLTPAQQEIYRLAFEQKIADVAANTRDGAAVANRFQTEAFRRIITEFYPQSAGADVYQRGQEMLRNLRREAITTSTKNFITAGSRTAELSSDMERGVQTAKTAAAALTLRVGKVWQELEARLATELGREGASRALQILTTTDPARVLQNLNRMALAAKTASQRQAYLTALRNLRSISAPRGAAALTADLMIAQRDRKNAPATEVGAR